MAVFSGPEIVNDGLIFHYDMDNVQKSWKGIPTTNEFDMTQMLQGNYGGDGTIQTGVADPFGGNNPVYRKTGKLRFGVTNGADVGTLYNGNQYLFSIYLRHVPNEVQGTSMEFDIVDRNGTRNFSGTLGDAMTYEWQRFYLYATHDNSVNYHFIDIGVYQGSNVFEWSCPMIEQTTRTWPAPFVANGSTRSNTEALIDLTGSETITSNSLTYNSDGTFSFNGSNTYASFSNPISENGPYTVIQWLKPSTALSSGGSGANKPVGTNRRTSIVGPGPVWNPGIWVTSDYIRVHAKTQYRDAAINWTTTDWKMIGMTYDGTNCQIIFNGEFLPIAFTTSISFATATTMYLGAETTGGSSANWLGNIGATQMYNKVLTAAEIKQNFEATRSRYGI